MFFQRADQRAGLIVAIRGVRMRFVPAERRFLRRRFVTGVGVRMFFQRADQRAGLIVAIRGVGMFLMPTERRARRGFRFGRFFWCFAIILLLRQNAEAEKPGLVQRVLLADHAAADVSFDRGERRAVRRNLRHKGDMVGIAVAARVKEDQIAGLRRGSARGGIAPERLQLLRPADAARLRRDAVLRHARVMQAERGEHRAPLAVRAAVPRAVARIAVHPAGFIYDIIARAGGIAELAFCHRYDVRAPLPAERLRDRLLPDGRGLQIGLRVGVAAEAVHVLRLFADQPRLIARVGVDVGRDLRLVLRLALLERADQLVLRLVAVLRVRVFLALLLPADKDKMGRVAVLSVDVRRRLLHRQLLVLAADEDRLIAALVVRVRLLPAEGLLRHGQGGACQGISGRGGDSAAEPRDPYAPFAPPCLRSRVAARLFLQVILHLCHLPSPYRAEARQRPDPENDLSHDLIRRHAAHSRAARVDRDVPVVTHQEIPLVRHLIGQRDRRLAIRMRRQIGLVEDVSVDGNDSIRVDVDPVRGACDIPLDQKLVAVIKCRDIARRERLRFDRHDQLSVGQRRRHRAAVDPQHRHPERGDQHSQRRNHEQDRRRAPQRPAIPPLVAQAAALARDLLRGRQIRGRCVFLHRFAIPLNISCSSACA